MAIDNTRHTQYRWSHVTQHAFTLVESITSMVIVAIMLVAALNMVGSAARARTTHATQEQGPALASHLMTEILQTYYREPRTTEGWGLETDEVTGTRSAFDDVDDYDGWTESPPALKNGTPLTAYAGWKRTVQVQYVYLKQPNLNIDYDMGLKRVTVTVTSSENKTTSLVALRAEDGAYTQIPEEDATLIGWVGVELQIGDGAVPIASGVNLLNNPNPPLGGFEALVSNPGNHPPTAVASGSPLSGEEDLLVYFSGKDSTDPDPGDALSYTWDFGDGNTGGGVMTSHKYTNDGVFTVTLTVTDSQGGTDTDTLTVTVYND